MAGVITSINKGVAPERDFTVTVDAAAYPVLDAQSASLRDGIVLEPGTRHRWRAVEAAPRLNVAETWAEAQTAPNTFRFTPTANQTYFYNHPVTNSLWVTPERGGDLFNLNQDCPDFIVNNVTTRACRGRLLTPERDCPRLRLINCQFLRTGNRAIGINSGGINDHPLSRCSRGKAGGSKETRSSSIPTT